MGWLWVWLQGREERRAEAAVRRQMAAVDTFRQVTHLDDGSDWAQPLTFQLPNSSPATVVCGSCGAVLLRGPVTVPAALLEHIQPCGKAPL